MAQSVEIQGLLAEINRLSTPFTATGGGSGELSDDSRQQLIDAARNLATALEDTESEVWRFAFIPAAHSIALVAWQRNLLAPWPKNRMTADELGEFTKIDPVLIGNPSFRALPESIDADVASSCKAHHHLTNYNYELK